MLSKGNNTRMMQIHPDKICEHPPHPRHPRIMEHFETGAPQFLTFFRTSPQTPLLQEEGPFFLCSPLPSGEGVGGEVLKNVRN